MWISTYSPAERPDSPERGVLIKSPHLIHITEEIEEVWAPTTLESTRLSMSHLCTDRTDGSTATGKTREPGEPASSDTGRSASFMETECWITEVIQFPTVIFISVHSSIKLAGNTSLTIVTFSWSMSGQTSRCWDWYIFPLACDVWIWFLSGARYLCGQFFAGFTSHSSFNSFSFVTESQYLGRGSEWQEETVWEALHGQSTTQRFSTSYTLLLG